MDFCFKGCFNELVNDIILRIFYLEALLPLSHFSIGR